ncbi:hypothetical protein ACFU53_22645 [Streptomyces sp. NPDC057474]|uniref:hypothetical protein n=1 Tax=Streptomyces sp. NPDC057474 TaxID=3346144 RepID=UPI0036904240
MGVGTQAAGGTLVGLLDPAGVAIMDRLVILHRVGQPAETLDVTRVEVGVDVARDASGRWRHPARWHRSRPDLSPTDAPRLTAPPH